MSLIKITPPPPPEVTALPGCAPHFNNLCIKQYLSTKRIPGIGEGTLSTVSGDMVTQAGLLYWLKVLTCSDYGLLLLAGT
jgi:hypothetical protein